MCFCDALVKHPDAIEFLQIPSERVFQQPLLFAPTISKRETW
jgi:hypothetical protein